MDARIARCTWKKHCRIDLVKHASRSLMPPRRHSGPDPGSCDFGFEHDGPLSFKSSVARPASTLTLHVVQLLLD